MAKAVTLLVVRTAVRQMADMVGSTFCSDTEIDGYINRAYGELYDLLVEKFGEEFNLSTSTSATVADQNDYALPATFYKLRGIDLSEGTDYVSLRRFALAERNTRKNGSNRDIRYALAGANVRLIPAPPAGRTIRFWFVPAYTTLTVDADTFDGINGWEEYVIVDAAIRCLQKEESDVSVLFAQKQALKQRIEAAASSRDSGSPRRVLDVDAVDDEEWGLR